MIRSPHRGEPILERERLWAAEKGPAEFVLPENTQEEQQHTQTAGVLLPCLHWEHTNILLHVRMVHQLHSITEESAPEGHQHRPKDRRLLSSHTGRSTQCPLSQKSLEHHTGHTPSGSLPVWTVAFRQTINTRTNRLKHSFYPTAITTLNAAKKYVQYGSWCNHRKYACL